MIEYKAPKHGWYNPWDTRLKIFLAGSIEMGKAEMWQQRVTNELQNEDVIILNPRRDDFNPNAKQEKTDPYFSEQVNWEQDAIEGADIVFFYFAPGTMSPISLLELGECIGLPDSCADDSRQFIVCCPQGYWRKGNIDIVCERNSIPVHESLDQAVGALLDLIENLQNGGVETIDMTNTHYNTP